MSRDARQPGAVPRSFGAALRLLGACALVFALCSGAASAIPANERRIALVVGNAKYATIPLNNPNNDARLIASNLRRLGFDVAEFHDLGVREFRRVLRDFARRVQEEPGASVFYYAGHGVQIDGRNYLLPVNINLRDEEEVKDESVDVDELFLSRIDRARSSARIVILDACRDNPFAGKTRNIKTTGGLAEMAARGALIAFASAPGAAAEDGPDGSNSVYSKHLADEMMQEGVEVEQMFKNVRVKVLRDTKERQIPWVNTSLTVNFSFNPGKSPSAQANELTQEKMERLEAEIAALRRQLSDTRLGASAAAAAAPSVGAQPAAPATTTTKIETDLEQQIRELEAARAAAKLARASDVRREPEVVRAAPATPPPAVLAPPVRPERAGPGGKAVADKVRCSELLHRASIGDPLGAEDEVYLMTVCR